MLLKTRDADRRRVAARTDVRARPGAHEEPAASDVMQWRLGAAPALALLAAGGLVMVAFGNDAAREGTGGAQPLFWGGLAAIYAPIFFRLLSASASRAERITLVAVLAVSLFAVRILAAPTGFVRFDELGTWRATNEVLQTGRLLSPNPLIVSTAGFPGLEAVTASVAQLGHLSIFHAGEIVLGLARLTLMVVLFLFLERTTRSARAAGIGVAVYACNPSFLYFDAQFAYESLALMLAATFLLLALSWAEPDAGRPRPVTGLVVAMALLAATVTMTHHMSSYALLAFLGGWTGLTALAARKSAAVPEAALGVDGAATFAPQPRSFLEGPGLPALLMAGMAITWFVLVAGSVTIDELGNVISGAVHSTVRLIFGGSDSKALFAGGGQSNSLGARALAIGSVIPLLALIPLGFKRSWRTPDATPLWRTLALTALLYPITLGMRLTQAGSETSQRASEFVFVGVAFFAAIVIGRGRWPRRWVTRNAAALALTAVALVVFLGGFIIGELPATRQPGPFLVGAEDRSITPQGIDAARFAASNLPPHSRVLVDRPNGTLMASYGDLNPVFGELNGTPVTRVFFSAKFDRRDRRVIKDDLIDYIVVDRRLSHELPVLGYYVEPDEAGAFRRTEPINPALLAKFNGARGLSKVYANGPISIYSTAGLKSR
ncbi:MAG: hypothetical protein ACRDLL_04140 [Solirubrobacterales bacterium]